MARGFTNSAGSTSTMYFKAPSGAYDITGPLTISSWVRVNAIPSAGSQSGIIGKWWDGTKAQIQLYISNNQLVWSTDSGGEVGVFWTFGTNLKVKTWYHIAGTYDGTNWTLYQSGIQRGQTAAIAPVHTGELFTIGCGTNAGTFVQALNGAVHDPAVWTEGLSAPEIALLASGVSPGKIRKSSLAGWWDLGEGLDKSQYKNDLTKVGSVTVTDAPVWGVNKREIFYKVGQSTGINGDLSVTAANATITADGTNAIAGALSVTGAAAAITSAATNAIVGTLSLNAADASISAAGTTGSPITGDLSVTLAAATISAAATNAIAGALTVTGAAASISAAGTDAIAAALSLTAGAATPNAAGTAAIAGAATITAATVAVSAAGTAAIVGTLSLTAANATISATGIVGSTGGDLSVTTDPASISAAGVTLIAGALSVTGDSVLIVASDYVAPVDAIPPSGGAADGAPRSREERRRKKLRQQKVAEFRAQLARVAREAETVSEKAEPIRTAVQAIERRLDTTEGIAAFARAEYLRAFPHRETEAPIVAPDLKNDDEEYRALSKVVLRLRAEMAEVQAQRAQAAELERLALEAEQDEDDAISLLLVH